MPRLLAQRADAAYDCIATFRDAAGRRFREGLILRDQGHWTAAVYLMGYAVEMSLKLAVFRSDGFALRQPITIQDLRRLVKYGCDQYGLPAPRNLHDIAFWALFLVQHRMARGRPYGSRQTARELLRRSHETYTRWRETLRYRTNVAYRHEVGRVAENAFWFLAESDHL